MIKFFKSFVFIFKRKPRYRGATNLIENWLNDPIDYDKRMWPEIEEYLYPTPKQTYLVKVCDDEIRKGEPYLYE